MSGTYSCLRKRPGIGSEGNGYDPLSKARTPLLTNAYVNQFNAFFLSTVDPRIDMSPFTVGYLAKLDGVDQSLRIFIDYSSSNLFTHTNITQRAHDEVNHEPSPAHIAHDVHAQIDGTRH